MLVRSVAGFSLLFLMGVAFCSTGIAQRTEVASDKAETQKVAEEVSKDPFDQIRPVVSGTETKVSAVGPNRGQDDRIKNALAKPISFRFEETTFEEIREKLSDDFRINIILDQSAIDDSLSYDEPISFSVEGLPLGSAMRLMLKEKNATYLVRDGVLRIISMDVQSDPENFGMEVINCQNLLNMIRVAEKDRLGTVGKVLPLEKALRLSSMSGEIVELAHAVKPGDRVGNNNVNQPADDESVTKSLVLVQKTTPESLLKNILITSVDPRSWQETDGDGSANFIGGLLVLKQSEEAIANVKYVLRQLTEAMQQDEE